MPTHTRLEQVFHVSVPFVLPVRTIGWFLPVPPEFIVEKKKKIV